VICLKKNTWLSKGASHLILSVRPSRCVRGDPQGTIQTATRMSSVTLDDHPFVPLCTYGCPYRPSSADPICFTYSYHLTPHQLVRCSPLKRIHGYDQRLLCPHAFLIHHSLTAIVVLWPHETKQHGPCNHICP